MELSNHTMSDLFAQLGLPADEDAIERFIDAHRPLPQDLPLSQAGFWTPAQASFLRDEVLEDADWAEVIDSLSTALRG